MKKLFISFALITTAVLAGCLKDKNFDNGLYGTQIQEVKGVAFPEAASSPVTVGITGQAAPLVVSGPIVTLEMDGKPSEPVNVKVTVNQSLISATSGITPLPAGSFTVSPTDITIAVGEKQSNAIKITINNSNTLDPNLKYGVGIQLSSVSGDYKIAANQSKIVMAFTIKNKYDGIYQLTGFHNRPTLDAPYDEEVHLVTTGPSSVKMFWPALGRDAHPINGGATYYGTFTTEFYFDAADKLVKVDNPYTPGSPVFTIGPATTSRWVASTTNPNTGDIYAQYYYGGNTARMFTDTLKYMGPRP
jgi:hypothetical protein